jgi:aspartyl-tRNA(Asn)/glutamyl-tRNA(Gln) amidotransferase subunit A
LEAAGAVIIAKANLYQFGYGAPHARFGPPRNPWNAQHSCAGSSSGSAAAVAAGLCFGSVGSDTGGSIRVPAAFCGVVGLKPTFGRVSREGIIPISGNLDHAGPLARTVEDAALLFDALAERRTHPIVPAGHAEPDHGVRGLRLGVADLDGTPSHPDVAALVAEACRVLEREGAHLRGVRLPNLEHVRVVVGVISAVEAAEYHRRYLDARLDDYAPELRSSLLGARLIPAVDYVYAQRARRRIIHELAAVVGDLDALLLPTTPIPAYTLDQQTITLNGHEHDLRLAFEHSRLFNLTGHPALAVPCGFTREGLPASLQIVGKAFDDVTVLRIGRHYEQAAGWHAHRPPI